MTKKGRGWNQLVSAVPLDKNSWNSVRIQKIEDKAMFYFGVADPEDSYENFICHAADGKIFQRINGKDEYL